MTMQSPATTPGILGIRPIEILGLKGYLIALGVLLCIYIGLGHYLSTHTDLLSSNATLVRDALMAVIVIYTLTTLYHYIQYQLKRLEQECRTLGEGKFNIRPANNTNEFSPLRNSLSQGGRELERILYKVSASALEAHSASRAQRQMTQTTARNNCDQRSAINNLAGAIEELSSSINHIAEQVSMTRDSADNARDCATHGVEVMRTTVDAVERVAQCVNDAIERVTRLGQRSEEISRIVQVIHDITEQTNLLALNASIEAARAGEHGRGFAVVADEVRQLAIKTSQATGEITTSIRELGSEVKSIIASIESINHESSASLESSEQVKGFLSNIEESVRHTADNMTNAAASVEQQNAVVRDVAANIEAINLSAQDIEINSNESHDTAVYLETLSQRVITLMPGSADNAGDSRA